MEDSAFEALYTGAYVFVFIIALTVTIFLFSSITDFADLAYEYEETSGDSSVIVDTPVNQNLLLSSGEVMSYYYNYIKKDIYGDDSKKESYNVIIKTKAKDEAGADLSLISGESDMTISELSDRLGKNNKYILRYKSVDNVGNVTIEIQKATQAEIDAVY